MSTTATKAPVKSITIEQVEGLPSECTKSSHTTWTDANNRIMRICARSPADGTYNKCKVLVAWENDDTYQFRYDAAQVGSTSHEGSVSERVRSGLLYSAGLRCPAHTTQEAYEAHVAESPDRKERATRMLTSLLFEDAVTDIPTGKSAESKSAVELAREAMKADMEALRGRTPELSTTPSRTVMNATPLVTTPASTRTITPAQVVRAATPATATKKVRKDPIDALPPTDIRRRIKSLMTGAEVLAAESREGQRDLWKLIIDSLTILKENP